MNKIVGDMLCQAQKLIDYPSCLQPMGIVVTCFDFKAMHDGMVKLEPKTIPDKKRTLKL